MEAGNDFKVPFLNFRIRNKDDSYFEMIRNSFCPNFSVLSLTTFIIMINLIAFLITRILYRPVAYASFLQWPTQADPMLLDIQLIKHNKLYFYQTFTALFMHNSYLHIIGNLVFSFFIMYELQFCWFFNIPLGLLSGFLAHCFAILTLQGRYLGFSGVLCSYLGIFVAIVFTHCSYLQQRYRQQFCMIIVMVVFISFIALGMGASALIHLYGYLFGAILGTAFYPKHPQSNVNQTMDIIFKIIAVIIILLMVVLAILI